MDLHLLQQKLETVEKAILGMLSLNTVSDLIDEKISTLVQLVSEIPHEEAELSQMWCNRMVAIWTRQCEIDANHDDSLNLDPTFSIPPHDSGILSKEQNVLSPSHEECFPSTLQDVFPTKQCAQSVTNNCDKPLLSEPLPSINETLEDELAELKQSIASTFAATIYSKTARSKLEGQIAELIALTREIPANYTNQKLKWKQILDDIISKYTNLPSLTEDEAVKSNSLSEQTFAVEKMLLLRPLRRDTIERILGEINQAVYALPEDTEKESQLKDTFCEKAVQLMSHYVQLLDEEDNPKATENSYGLKAMRIKEPPVLAVQHTMYSGAKLSPIVPQYTIEGIRQTLENAFMRMSPFGMGFSPLEDIKDLIALGGKSQLLIGHSEPADESARKELSVEVSNWLVGKFTGKLFDAYCKQGELQATGSLDLLLEFLYAQLREYYLLVNAGKSQLNKKRSINRATSTYLTQLVGCGLCHSSDHLVDDCELRESLLCLKCFSYGHRKEYCTNAPLLPHNIVF